MSKEKNRQKKKHHKGKTNENEDNDERPRSRLFNETDANAIEVSDYPIEYDASQTYPLPQERMIPLGVVGVDESVKLPTSHPKSDDQHHDSKMYTVLQPSEHHHKEHVHLPAIAHHHHHQQPYEYYHPSSDYYHYGHLSHPYPLYSQHHLPHYSPPHHHHHHHHHRRHHKHKTEVETYDPRWWYMPLDSVHRPKPRATPEYRYVSPKWYESSNSQSRMSVIPDESKLSSPKYLDCRCEVCRPSKKPARGTRWIINE